MRFRDTIALFLSLAATGILGCERAAPSQQAALVIGGPGRAPGRFVTPRGICVHPGGAWVVDRSGRIQGFDLEGRLTRVLEISQGRAGFPLGLLAGRDGGFLLCDTHGAALRRFDSEGHEGEAFAPKAKLSLPQRAARDAHGAIYVTEFGSGKDCRVRVFDPSGQELRRFGHYGTQAGHFTRPMGIAIIGEEVFVADASDRIVVYSLRGEFLREIGVSGRGIGELRYPYGLCADGDALIVCEYANNRLQRFATDGRSLGVFGQPGRGDGCFSSPWDLAIDGLRRLWVCDSGNHRVVVLDLEQISWRGGSSK